MKAKLEEIRAKAQEELSKANAIETIEELRVKYAGKKGELTAILKQMGKLSPEERPVIGQLANEVRAFIENAVDTKKKELAKLMLEKQYLSITHFRTFPRPSSSKSVSISGSEIRSGFRKRSNSRSYFRGSIFVIPRQ